MLRVLLLFEHEHIGKFLNCTFNNKLSELKKRVNTEAAAHPCSVAILKYQKQPFADVLQISYENFGMF